MHLTKLDETRDAKAQEIQIVCTVFIDNETVMPIVHPKIATTGFAFINDFKPQNFSRIIFPRGKALDSKPHIAKLCHLHHFALSPFSPQAEASGERSFADRDVFYVAIEIETPCTAFASDAAVAGTAEWRRKVAHEEAVDP